jgi:hypothetical protein
MEDNLPQNRRSAIIHEQHEGLASWWSYNNSRISFHDHREKYALKTIYD